MESTSGYRLPRLVFANLERGHLADWFTIYSPAAAVRPRRASVFFTDFRACSPNVSTFAPSKPIESKILRCWDDSRRALDRVLLKLTSYCRAPDREMIVVLWRE